MGKELDVIKPVIEITNKYMKKRLDLRSKQGNAY